jgi:5-dehydro-2-deoxygluconokinase
MKRSLLVCVGDVCVDWVVRLRQWPSAGKPRHGQLEWIGSGGSAANVASAAARLGAPAALLAVVGKDVLAQIALSGPRAAGVRLDGVQTVGRGPTAAFISARLTGGDTKAMAFPATSGAPSAARLDRFGRVAAWFVSGHLLRNPGGAELAGALGARASRDGQVLAVDLAAYNSQTLRRLLPPNSVSTICFTSLEGADRRNRAASLALRILAELESYRRPQPVFRRPSAKQASSAPPVAVVKLAESGSLIASAGQHVRIPPVRVAMVDPLGAGDAYDGAFLWGYLRGMELSACGLLGSAAGALCAAHLGAQGPWLSRANMVKLLAQARLPKRFDGARRGALEALRA